MIHPSEWTAVPGPCLLRRSLASCATVAMLSSGSWRATVWTDGCGTLDAARGLVRSFASASEAVEWAEGKLQQ